MSEQASEQASHRAIEQASKPALRGASEPARVPAGGTHLPGVEGQKSDDISGPHGCEGLPHEGQRDVDERHREEEVVERRLLPLAAVARAQRGDGWRERGGGEGGKMGGAEQGAEHVLRGIIPTDICATVEQRLLEDAASMSRAQSPCFLHSLHPLILPCLSCTAQF